MTRQPRVCSCFRGGTIQCRNIAIARITTICVHEHMLTNHVCGAHVLRLENNRVSCRLCTKAGFQNCKLRLLDLALL